MSRDVDTFHKTGYSGPHTLFAPELSATLLRRAREEVFPVRCTTYAHTQADPGVVAFRKTLDPLYRRDRHLDSPLLYRIASAPAILARVAALIGPDILLWRSDTFEQTVGDAPTSPHQDGAFEGMSPHPMIEAGAGQTVVAHQSQPCDADIPLVVNVWIALTRVCKESGPLWVVPGTHDKLIPNVPGDGFAGRRIVLSRKFEPSDGIGIEMEAGQFVVFHNLLVHGSLPVREGMRFAWVCRYVAPAAHIHRRSPLGPQGQDLARWGAVLVAGQDRARNNVMCSPPILSAASIAEERALAPDAGEEP